MHLHFRSPLHWLATPLLLSCSNHPVVDPMAAALGHFLIDELPAAELEVTYSDLHPLHGGLELKIRGDGRAEQEALRQEVREPHDLPPAKVEALVRLLIELEAWHPETPERQAVPDESRASLSISAGDAKSEIWEWYNELEANDRLIRIREEMKRLAWQ